MALSLGLPPRQGAWDTLSPCSPSPAFPSHVAALSEAQHPVASPQGAGPWQQVKDQPEDKRDCGGHGDLG